VYQCWGFSSVFAWINKCFKNLSMLLLSSSSWSSSYSPLSGFDHLFSFLILYTVSWTPRMQDQPVARALPHRINTKAHIHALSGIWTHNPSIRGGAASSCLRPAATVIGSCHSMKFETWTHRKLIKTSHHIYINTHMEKHKFPKVIKLCKTWGCVF
jgi:hypothetical protein